MDVSPPSQLLDEYQRRIDYLRVSITDRCNLRCFYCAPLGGTDWIPHEAILRYEEIIRIVRIAAGMGVKKVRITGGEPLMRKGVVEFIRGVRQVDGISDLGLTTNGIFLEDFAGPLREAGLARVNISLDSLAPEKYERITGRRGLEKVLAGIDRAEEAGFSKIKVNAVLMGGVNEDEVVNFAEFAFSRGIEVRFIEYMPFLNGGEMRNDLFMQAERVKEMIEMHFTLIPVEGDGPGHVAKTYRLEGSEGRIGLITPVSRHFCERCNRIRLTADGKLKNCLYSNNEIDIRDPLRSGASDRELSEILSRSVREKPRRRPDFFCSFKKCIRTMNLIGG